MKFHFWIFFLFLSQITFGQKDVTVYGTITHPKGKKVYVKYYRDYLTYKELVADSATLDKKGHYAMQFSWKESYPATFYHGDELTEMFLSPGDSLQLNLDTKQFDETVKYEGKGAFVNNYLAKKALINPPFDPNNYMLPEDQFERKIDSIYRENEKRFNEYFSNTQKEYAAVKIFKQYESFEVKYDWANERADYPMYFKYFKKLKDDVVLSPGFNDYRKEAVVIDPKAIISPAYVQYLSSFVDSETKKTYKQDTTVSILMVRESFINHNLNDKPAEYILAEWVINLLDDENDIDDARLVYNKLKKEHSHSEYLHILDEKFEAANTLKAGNPAPEFTFPDLNHKMVSLSDFKGKVVYLDIWASWCGPCRAEIPYTSKLEEDFKNENVVFLAVSVDADEKAWKKLVTGQKLPGTHLLSAGNFESKIAQLYNVSGIPRYVLIDQEGRIVDNNAKRPSGDAKTQIQSVLNSK